MRFTKFVEMVHEICENEDLDIDKLELGLLTENGLEPGIELTPLKIPATEKYNEEIHLLTIEIPEEEFSDEEMVDIEIREMTEGKPFIRRDPTDD